MFRYFYIYIFRIIFSIISPKISFGTPSRRATLGNTSGIS
nr:MAG TPA: hypothetical protein [Bacteriophage sp.]